MQVTVRQDNKGFTLIEVLVACIILTIGMLGILETMVLSMQQNLNNYSRDESVRIAEQTMNELRNASFATLVSGSSTVTRQYKQVTRTFNVTWTATTLSTNSFALQIVVNWTIRGKVYSHSTTSIISRGV